MDYGIFFIKQRIGQVDCWHWPSPEGRRFYVLDNLHDGLPSLRLFESQPNGDVLKDGFPSSRSSSAQRLQKEMINGMGPSRFYTKVGPQIGLSKIFFEKKEILSNDPCESFPQVRDIISRHIDRDCWLSPPGLANQYHRNVNAREELIECIDYWKSVLSKLDDESNLGANLRKNVPDHCPDSIFTGVDSASKRQLMAFYERPDEYSWNELSGCILLGGRKSAWQIWRDNDESAQSSFSNGHWRHWPDPEKFSAFLIHSRNTLKKQSSHAIDHYQEKLRQINEASRFLVKRGRDGPSP